ncbi:MAG: hypothetical protein LC104_01290, partial [Bacteroidales bacterium]|nr:hypothetical protein [Bacteroidales bacterium]
VLTASRLLDGGADPNVVNNQGESVVRCAAAGGYTDTVDLLLCRGAVLDLKAATRLGWVDAVEDILRRSDDPQRLIDTTPLLGDDAIHAHSGIAPNSRSRPFDTLRYLLDKGMSPNQKDAPNGNPLVIRLTLESMTPLLRILLSYNVDINATIQRGNRTVTATDLAIDREDDEVVALLRAHGGKTYAELHPKRRK